MTAYHARQSENASRTPVVDRRGLLEWGARGIGATALWSLLSQEGQANRAGDRAQTAPGFPDHLPRAKRAIHICLIGGLSHVDSFDYKPELEKQHGKPLRTTEEVDLFFGQMGLLRKHDWAFRQRGESGLWISELFPQIATQADELTIFRSMVSESANHTPALFMQNSGFQFTGFPCVGSWVSYGLGSVSDALPSFVVLPDPRGGPNGGAGNWSNSFLPAQHQGVPLQNGERPVRDLFPASRIGPEEERATRRFLRQINERHLAESGGSEDLLVGRLKSYELAARMQLSVPEVCDLGGETQGTRDQYGLDDDKTAACARQCLLARRLLENGVRFVQIYSGGPIAGSPRASWDAHESVPINHGREAYRIDKPVAGLLADLKQRGMLEDTLVLFTTEFGRTPFTQAGADQVGTGRDHNRYGFSVWMAGAGLKPGYAYGSTDDLGWKAVENAMTWHDFHATVLYLLGIDHTRLTFYHNGIRRRLTNVHGEVAHDVIR